MKDIGIRSSALLALGWSASWEHAFRSVVDDLSALEPGRVVASSREQLRVVAGDGEEDAVIPGRLLFAADSALELPCTGDWLALRRSAPGGPLLVERVVPRRTLLVRRAAGRSTAAQPLAANVDVALLVAALTGDFSPRRLERWLALARDAGADPVVVLTKVDLCADPAPLLAAAQEVAAAAPVLALDALGGTGVGALAELLRPGTTVALLGSSGVGKSTLANRLAGREVAATSAIAADGRGRHTTTRRELLPLAGGAILLDTPGLREVGLWLGGQALAGLFPEIETAARSCRFRDCMHDLEPGCAVRAAIAAGDIDAARLASLHKLRAEEGALARRTDEGAAREEKRRVRALHRAARKHRPRWL